MLFSKSFGYALRGVLYVALMQDEKKWVQVDEIAERLSVPRYFMGKIMKRLAKEQILVSAKGPYGGFSLKEQTLKIPIYKIVEITDGLSTFRTCVLRLQECNSENPCPLHGKVEEIKHKLQDLLQQTTVEDLMLPDKKLFLESIVTNNLDYFLLDHTTTK